MPRRKVTKSTRKQRKPITHSRRRRRTRTTRRRRKGGYKKAIYDNSATELLDCINKTCKTQATKWGHDWAVVKNDQSELYKYVSTINKSKAEMAKACAQCDVKLGLTPGTALVAAMRNENSPNIHIPR